MNILDENELESMESSMALSITSSDLGFLPTKVARQHKFEEVLKHLLPHLGSDESKIILAEILIALKLEGVLGKTLTEKDTKMVKVLNEAIHQEPSKKKQALKFAYRLLK